MKHHKKDDKKSAVKKEKIAKAEKVVTKEVEPKAKQEATKPESKSSTKVTDKKSKINEKVVDTKKVEKPDDKKLDEKKVLPIVLNQQTAKSPEIDMKDLKIFEASFVDKNAEEDEDEDDDGKKKTTNLVAKKLENTEDVDESDFSTEKKI